jgi:SpoVK/Ycf46/Vps4 family AAA+-type ATPase
MARGELMKKLIASYGRDEEFRAVAEQIILEEEQKNNKALAQSLRRSLESTPPESSTPRQLAPLIPFPDPANDFIERVDGGRFYRDVTLSPGNARVLQGLRSEFQHGDEIRRHGLPVRSKLLFCGPPGNGKTVTAEAFSGELGLPMFVVKLDRLISSYLGETASNIRKIFEFARKQPCVLFLDEFDALARSRDDSSEHNELRRVVNSLLVFIDRIRPKGFLIAATNLEKSLDAAIWRRLDEVIWFERPDRQLVRQFLIDKFKNVKAAFEPGSFASRLAGRSYAEIERISIQAIKTAILEGRRDVRESDLAAALAEENRRRSGNARMKPRRAR